MPALLFIFSIRWTCMFAVWKTFVTRAHVQRLPIYSDTDGFWRTGRPAAAVRVLSVKKISFFLQSIDDISRIDYPWSMTLHSWEALEPQRLNGTCFNSATIFPRENIDDYIDPPRSSDLGRCRSTKRSPDSPAQPYYRRSAGQLSVAPLRLRNSWRASHVRVHTRTAIFIDNAYATNFPNAITRRKIDVATRDENESSAFRVPQMPAVMRLLSWHEYVSAGLL